MAKAFKKAAGRGVKIRCIMGKNDESYWAEPMQDLTKISSFEIKFIQKSHLPKLKIFDDKEVFIAIHPTTHETKSPELWTNNPDVIGICKNFFENLWSTARNTI